MATDDDEPSDEELGFSPSDIAQCMRVAAAFDQMLHIYQRELQESVQQHPIYGAMPQYDAMPEVKALKSPLAFRTFLRLWRRYPGHVDQTLGEAALVVEEMRVPLTVNKLGYLLSASQNGLVSHNTEDKFISEQRVIVNAACKLGYVVRHDLTPYKKPLEPTRRLHMLMLRLSDAMAGAIGELFEPPPDTPTGNQE